MTTEVRLPQAGMAMTDGEVVTWRKAVGEAVEQGETLVEVEAAKIIVEVEAPVSGVLEKILVEEGSVAAVLDVLAIIREPADAGTGAVDGAPEPLPASVATVEHLVERVGEVLQDKTERVGRRQVAPAARKLAAELGLDLAQVTGSGPGGRVVVADVRAHGRAQPTGLITAAPVTTIRASQVADSLLYFSSQVDVTELVRMRPVLRREFGATYTDVLVRAGVLALGEFPALNARRSADESSGDMYRVHPQVDVRVVGVETSSTSVLVDARGMNLAQISGARAAASEEHAATFVVINLGDAGIDVFMPFPDRDAAAAIGVGRIEDRLFRRPSGAEWRKVVVLGLSVREGVVDVGTAAAFLRSVSTRLADPSSLL